LVVAILGVGRALLSLPLLLWCHRNKSITGHFNIDNHGGVTLLHGTVLLDYNEIDTGVAMKELEKNAALSGSPEVFRRRSRSILHAQRFLPSCARIRRASETMGCQIRELLALYPRTDKAITKANTAIPAPALAAPDWSPSASSSNPG